MSQKLFDNLDNWIILVIVIYITLVFFGILKYPFERSRVKAEELKNGRYGVLIKIALPVLIVLLVARIAIGFLT
jgi:hypothetical protein